MKHEPIPGHKLTLMQAIATTRAGMTILTRRNAGFVECRILEKLDDEFARVQFTDSGHTTVTMYFWEKTESLFPADEMKKAEGGS